jgi:CheY-like chemotaxis protein
MGFRREERIPLQVSALVSGLDCRGRAFTQEAKTLDISPCGARIAGITFEIDPGSVLSIQLANRKARFQVLWVGEAGSDREGEIGLKCIEVGTHTRKRLLYVDDQEFEVEMRRGIMETAGYEIECARSGREAVDLLRNYPFDAVILDYPLHDIDCGDIVEAIKHNLPETKIVLLSVYPGKIPEPVLALADAFIHKGEPRQKLLAKLEEMIGPATRLKWPLARANSRFAIRMPIEVKLFRDGFPVIISGRSTDLNESGMGGVLEKELLPGEMVTLEFRLPIADEMFTARATVRRRSGNQYGFEFVSVEPQQQQAIRSLCEVLPPIDVPQPM